MDSPDVLSSTARSSDEERRLRLIIEATPNAMLMVDVDGRIVLVNSETEKLFGYQRAELLAMRVDELIPERFRGHHRGFRRTFFDHPDTRAMGAGRHLFGLRSDGSEVPIEIGLNPLETDEGVFVLAAIIDITERKRSEERLREAEAALQEDAMRRALLAEVTHLANHDVLTDLPNRTMLLNHLVDAIARADRDETEIVVLLLDLDHFKRINDSMGHHMGDELLLAMSARLQHWVREDDLVARLGGDEFVVVFGGVPDGKALTPRIEELMQVVLAPVDVHSQELAVTVSMGGVRYPADGGDPATLLKNADTAMYHAKASGRNNFQWFYDAMLDETNDKMAIAAALRQALDRDELSVVYQPQVDLGTGQVVGMEALARWDSPELGPVGPDRFIPVAEDSGMIRQLGQWVLHRACRDALEIERAFGTPLRLAVNVSPRQFHSPEWGAVVAEVLEETCFDPHRLELEITEGILMDDPYDVIEQLQVFRGLGIAIVVDDFGTGFSSLSYLTRFPIDKIKIDRSFVREVNLDDADAAIVDTIIVMAHTLGMTVVAEGVETRDQERYLQRRACDEAQGFRYGAGVAAGRFAEVVAAIAAP
jgi:diguanylate cyclase (GGDEF)-like protein/PAS domain S-box-containing protein